MSWTWLFVERSSGRCLICEGDDKSHIIKSANTTNNATHLANVHKLSANDERVKQAQEDQARANSQPTIDSALAKRRADDAFLDYMLVYAVPIARTEDALFRAVHPSAPNSRNTLRTRIVAQSSRRCEEALRTLAGRTVTLAIDAGTIWKKYFAIVALCWGIRPVLVALDHSDSMPATWIEDSVSRAIAKLTNFGAFPVGIVADNAANVQLAMRQFPLLQQRCLAHSIQLCVNDAMSLEPLSAIWSAAKVVLKDNGKPEPPVTRWSGKYLALREIVDPDAKLVVGSIGTDEFQAMLPATRALQPFYTATQLVQGNGATLVTAAAVVHSLLSLETREAHAKLLAVATKKRMAFLLTDAIVVAAFFHPAVSRNTLPHPVKDKVFSIVRGVMKTIAGEGVLAEWQRMKIEPPNRIEPNVAVNTKAYGIYWMKTAYPLMAVAITRLIESNPTEAACERAFSAVKFAFPRLRSTAGDDLVTSTVLGASAVACLKGYDFEDDEPTQVAEVVDDREKVNSTLTGEAAMVLISAWCDIYGANEQPLRRPPRTELQLCGRCRKNGKSHPSDCRWVKCTTCATWFAFPCVGIADEDYVIVEQAETWTCQDCKNFHVVTN